MRILWSAAGALLSLTLILRLAPEPARAQAPATPDPDTFYKLGPDSLPQPSVPKGEVRGPFVLPDPGEKGAYPGTIHDYWVYVPAQYDPKTPAALMVFQDGQAYLAEDGSMHAQTAMDNLIFKREIPVMIGVFINPGRRPDQPQANLKEWGDRTSNRPTEYNVLDDRYARVLINELLPVLKNEMKLNISDDPEQRGIGGTSSGGIAAFTVAWERPDQFRKVLSIVGSFVNLRGGYVYPEKIRESPKKPIRVFLNDGRNDNRGVATKGKDKGYDEKRDWFFQNVRLKDALVKKGYDVNYVWGLNTHGHKMGAAIFPEMMRWLWRDQAVSTDPRDQAERSNRVAQ